MLCCVDGIQSLGALPLDVAALAPDFVVADGHKWLLGPEGLGFMYVRPELIGQLQLYQYGWHMVEHAGDYDRSDWAPAASARRFECGSPNMLGVHALVASVSLLLEVGPDTIAENVLDNTRHLMDWVDQRPELELITPREGAPRGHRHLPGPGGGCPCTVETALIGGCGRRPPHGRRAFLAPFLHRANPPGVRHRATPRRPAPLPGLSGRGRHREASHGVGGAVRLQGAGQVLLNLAAGGAVVLVGELHPDAGGAVALGPLGVIQAMRPTTGIFSDSSMSESSMKTSSPSW